MSEMDNWLSKLPPRHKVALRWFANSAGTIQSWPDPLKTPEGATLLVTRAKGIYKPKWSHYALSVRHSLSTDYDDHEPIFEKDGSWRYSYYQENPDPAERDKNYTNRGLLACAADVVPVGVLQQMSEKPSSTYRILGLAVVTGWSKGHFLLKSLPPMKDLF